MGFILKNMTGNPLIDCTGGDRTEDSFRDPKVWKHGEKYYLVSRRTSRNHRGLASDLPNPGICYHWEYLNVLAESRGEWGYMWECPDFYPLGRYGTYSRFRRWDQGIIPRYTLVGDFDYQTGRFEPHESGEMDWGFDYYAPQSVAGTGRTPCWSLPGRMNGNGCRFLKDWGPTYQRGMVWLL